MHLNNCGGQSSMNKGLIWFLVIVSIIVIGIFVYVGMQSSQEDRRVVEQGAVTGTDEGYTDIQTGDDDFIEIDRALEFID